MALAIMRMMRKMSNYWQKRIINAQNKVADKSIVEIERHLKGYYKKVMQSTIEDAENLYARLLSKQEAGKAILASDMYRLDSYWKLVADMRDRLQTLGDKEVELLEKEFIEVYNSVYESIPGLPVLDSGSMFNGITDIKIKQLINSVWCADGKSWSQRIWGNINNLQETLNEELTSNIISGKKFTQLKQALQDRFNVSYGQADRLIRTETTHIQTQAAYNRYKDAGVEEYEVLAGDDEKMCPDCGKMNGKKFKITEMVVGVNAPPFHASCRCTISPVINIDLKED